MLDLNLKSLRLLIAVCEHGNIKRAAEQAHIEPSAVSKRITLLEETLGTALLERTRHGVAPTAAGLALLEHARQISYTADRIHSDMNLFQHGIKGQVRLAASASAIAESLLEDITEFMQDDGNQQIQIDIEEHVSRELLDLVRDGAVALGVCWDNSDFAQLECQPYRCDTLALVVPAKHPLANRAVLSFEQTLAYPHVGLPPSTAVHIVLARAAAQVGQVINYRTIVSNFEAELRVVAAGLGISVTPREIAERYEKMYKLRVIPLSDEWARRRFVICSREPDKLQPAAQRLVRFLATKVDRSSPVSPAH